MKYVGSQRVRRFMETSTRFNQSPDILYKRNGEKSKDQYVSCYTFPSSDSYLLWTIDSYLLWTNHRRIHFY